MKIVLVLTLLCLFVGRIKMIQIKNAATQLVLGSDDAGQVFTSEPNGGQYQNWTFTPSYRGYAYPLILWTIKNSATNLCLDSNSSGKIQTSDCGINQGKYQKWTIKLNVIINYATRVVIDSDSNGNVYSSQANDGNNQNWYGIE